MKPILIVHGYSAESRTSTEDAIRKIYGELPAVLRDHFGAQVEELDLSRYISLEDGITIDDISRALNRTLERDYPDLLSGGCNVIVHSTGALVVRNWLLRYWNSDEKCPFERVIHLAGANFGSGWAHIGRTQFAKWVRMIFQRVERGVNVLKALELGSNWTIEMQKALDHKLKVSQIVNRPLEFCLIGSQRPDEFQLIPVKYATEEATDGVVRVPGGNLNFSYLKVVAKDAVGNMSPAKVRDLAKKGFAVTSRRVKSKVMVAGDSDPSEHYYVEEGWSSRPVPFSVVFDCSHTYKSSSIVDGERPRDQVLRLLETALDTEGDMDGAIRRYQEEHDWTLDQVRKMKNGRYLILPIPRRPQYNRYSQIVFRVFDQDGHSVKHFNVYFNSFGGGEEPRRLINDFFKDGHPNGESPNTITFFVQRAVWSDKTKEWEDVTEMINGVDLEIDAVDHGNDLVQYLPLRYRIDKATLKDWLKEDQTTIVDVHLYRMPSDEVFKIVPDRDSVVKRKEPPR